MGDGRGVGAEDRRARRGNGTDEVPGTHNGVPPRTFNFSQLLLTSCLGAGTYGTVLAGSLPHRGEGLPEQMVLKVPKQIGRWGERHISNELRAIAAMHRSRNIVRLHGIVYVPLSWLAQKAIEGRREAKNRGRSGAGCTGRERGGTRCLSWECLNHTDIRDVMAGKNVSDAAQTVTQRGAVLAMVLERLPPGRILSLERALRSDSHRLDEYSKRPGVDPIRLREWQMALFQTKVEKARRDAGLTVPQRRVVSKQSTAAWDLLIGLARGYERMHEAMVVHRDLVLSGKNVLLKSDKAGITSVLMDFSAARKCPVGSGGLLRAMDAYYFGGVVSWLCYGRDTHPTWELKTRKPFVALHYHCHDLVRELEGSYRDELADLIGVHHRYHPDGRPSPAKGLINRCTARQQRRLDSIMKATWRPLLDRWRAGTTPAAEANDKTKWQLGEGLDDDADGPGKAGHSAEWFQQLWRTIGKRLIAMRQEDRSFFRFNDFESYSNSSKPTG